ncbi:MAG TPA: hypothetical protein VGY77_01160 [Gemmataceae bacterium]|jgi:hypothetical protein|nr:hypothetical protein [Gemmataceae bacterium]
MNCQDFRNLLLVDEDPCRPASAVQAHIQVCEDCRKWQNRLNQLERNVPLLPIPTSDAKANVLRLFRSEIPMMEKPASVEANGNPEFSGPIVSSDTVRFQLRKLIPRHRWYAAAGVAAALLVLIFDALVLWNPHGPVVKETKKDSPKDAFLANLMDRNLRLAEAKSPHKRLEALADLADDLQTHTRKIIRKAQAGDLQQLARLYEQVIREGIGRSAKEVSPGQRLQVLKPIAERLTRAGRDAGGMASDVPDESAGALRLIASAAKKGGDELRVLFGEQLP